MKPDAPPRRLHVCAPLPALRFNSFRKGLRLFYTMSACDALFPEGFHETSVEVRYAETDQMGYAHHSTAVLWLEIGRIDWLRALGFPYGELERRGVFMPVVRLALRYLRPARFEDRLCVQTRLVELGQARLAFASRIVKLVGADDAPSLVAEGRVELACVDEAGRVRGLPNEIAVQLRRHVATDEDEG